MERAPSSFAQFDRETIAAQAALRAAQEEQFIQDAAAAARMEQEDAARSARMEQVSPVDQEGNLKGWNLNDLAELQAFGSQGREYVDPGTGKRIADKEHVLPGMVDRIRNDERFGKTPEEREKVAKDYTDTIHAFVEEGFEPTQAKLLADASLRDSVFGIPAVTKNLIAAGERPDEAQRRAEELLRARDQRRVETVRKHAFMTAEQYQSSPEARKDSLDFNQELLATELRLEDRYNQNNQVRKYLDQGMSLEEAQKKAAKLYSDKYDRQLKTIYENGIDSREAYDAFLKRKAPSNTAAEKPDDAETKEIPIVDGKEREIKLEGMSRDHLRLTKLIAKDNEGHLTPKERKEWSRLQAELNGDAEAIADKYLADTTMPITRDEILRRISKSKSADEKRAKIGLPTHEDRQPLTGDMLVKMFSKDSEVAGGGLTSDSYKLIEELYKNQTTRAAWRGPHPASARRGREIERLTALVNDESEPIPQRWIIKNGKVVALTPGSDSTLEREGNYLVVDDKGMLRRKAKDGSFTPVDPNSYYKPMGDLIREKFAGGREAGTSTRRGRLARWAGKNILRLELAEGRTPEAPEGRTERTGRARRVGRTLLRGAGFGPSETRIELPGANAGTPEEVAARKARREARQAEIDAGRRAKRPGPGTPEGGTAS